ncbi:exonuclease domain-containing protein [Fulvivirga kasyanovii]|uniref:Exonuclease domain-containing protein n=1 Tax=Fulvivirga kasyanovii TaxID=396812 RepID=A0ABW9RYD9_9BACT|nr:3'-5' exonuclease [Fulvivirga kasyanovii]MTI28722.1 exonuclease domain-containing protein [Fulvivirga kasyanovii]
MNYIIFDLESTCWKEKSGRIREIIEIGAVKIDSAQNIVSEFDAFVKPIINPRLSDFCQELTSIQQNDIDKARPFPQVISDFQTWIDIEAPYVLCSWGFYDRTQLKADCSLHGVDASWVNAHISLKHQFAEIKKLRRPVGMKAALKHEGFELSGTHHRGIDDARNIAKVFQKNFQGWKF